MANVVVGLFEHQRVARGALTYLAREGYTEEDITVCVKATDSNCLEHNVVIAPALPYRQADYSSDAPEQLLSRILAVHPTTISECDLLIAGRMAKKLCVLSQYIPYAQLQDWLTFIGADSSKAPYYAYGLAQGDMVILVRARPGDEERLQENLRLWGRGLDVCVEQTMPRPLQPFRETYDIPHAPLIA